MSPSSRDAALDSLPLFPDDESAPTRADDASLSVWPGDLGQVAPGWRHTLEGFLRSETGLHLSRFLQERVDAGAVIYPPSPWRALTLTPPGAVRVVILGQDPYHGPGQANGLAFDVSPGIKVPPSLRNIHKELAREYGRPPQVEGLLEHWAAQGVLLLNTSFTVEAGQAASHSRLGWQSLSDAILDQLVESTQALAFVLWGAHAQSKAIGREGASSAGQRLWLQANHPSPLSALRPPMPFIGCGHFRQVNDFLALNGSPPIDWLGEERSVGG